MSAASGRTRPPDTPLPQATCSPGPLWCLFLTYYLKTPTPKLTAFFFPLKNKPKREKGYQRNSAPALGQDGPLSPAGAACSPQVCRTPCPPAREAVHLPLRPSGTAPRSASLTSCYAPVYSPRSQPPLLTHFPNSLKWGCGRMRQLSPRAPGGGPGPALRAPRMPHCPLKSAGDAKAPRPPGGPTAPPRVRKAAAVGARPSRFPPRPSRPSRHPRRDGRDAPPPRAGLKIHPPFCALNCTPPTTASSVTKPE